jgi:hypothetical protein
MDDDSTQVSVLRAVDALRQATESSGPLKEGDGISGLWSPELVMTLCGGLMVLCMVSMFLVAWILKKRHASADQILQVFAILSIINVAAIILIAGYSAVQVSPIVGLFGAIAGYLIGKDRAASPDHQANSNL